MPARVPAWQRLRAPDGVQLRVERPEAIALDLLELDDGDLPQLGGATAFLVERTRSGFRVWAALIAADGSTRTYLVTAARLRIRAADDAIARHLGFQPSAPPGDVDWSWVDDAPPSDASEATTRDDDVVCACRGITRAEIDAAIRAGWRSVDGVKRATKATFGECQSRGCAGEIAALLGLPDSDPRAAITPRPPLVPVPTSILAAFAL